MGRFYERLCSQAACPRGFWGRLLARWLMPMGYRPLYESANTALNFKPEDDYPEVAFGPGVSIKKYASNASSVAGLDYSKDMVQMAARVNRKRADAGMADFRHDDASQLPWKDNKFSAAAVMGAFEVLPMPLKSIKELYRVLHPGGEISYYFRNACR